VTVGTGTLVIQKSNAIQRAPAVATTKLAGWGKNLRADCYLREPETPEQVGAWLDRSGSIARGLGRSYGDQAINAGGQVLGMTRVDRYLGFDEPTGTLVCEAGVSLEQIIADFAPRGWFPMITPGTKFVTVGGCIANDIHGKAHHVQGAFSTSVDAMTVLLASGEVVVASRTENPDLFFATFGGMGLLGVVLTATLRLRKIETTYFRQKNLAVKDLAEMLAVLDEQDRIFPYSVATLDVFAKGASLGRGRVTVGEHARLEELPSELRSAPLRVSPGSKLTVPFELPEIALNSLSMRVVNAVIQQVLVMGRPFGHYEGFFYPLDVLAHWNRGYGRRGFTQYQFVIPFADGELRMREILTAILSAGELPFLNVLKRMGKESGGVLSFPREGYTLAIDFPIRQNTAAVLRRIDRMVLDAGGRVYLGKDSYLERDMFRAMYPQIDGWLETKAKYDPRGVFTSNLGRRLGMVL
jgi:decaprenylphospho-beta-D-ribofuranose 2-oxidase